MNDPFCVTPTFTVRADDGAVFAVTVNCMLCPSVTEDGDALIVTSGLDDGDSSASTSTNWEAVSTVVVPRLSSALTVPPSDSHPYSVIELLV